MDYISERITNISDLEAIIEKCSIMAQVLQNESENKKSFQPLIEALKDAKNFEFKIEQRRIVRRG